MLGPTLSPLPDTRSTRLVEGWWATTASGRGTVVPDGATDLLWVPGRVPFLAGPDRVPRPVELAAGTRLVGLRLRPGVAPAVLGDGLDRAVGCGVPLDRVRSRVEVDRLLDDLGSAVDRGSSTDLGGSADRGGPVGHGRAATHAGRARDEVAARALTRAVARLVPLDWVPDAVVVDAAAAIRSDRSPTVAGLGPRQFRRRFTAAMGYGPGLYRRIVRLDRVTDLMAGQPDRNLADLAAAAGFYDQAHLSRDCRELLGATPSTVRAGLAPAR